MLCQLQWLWWTSGYCVAGYISSRLHFVVVAWFLTTLLAKMGAEASVATLYIKLDQPTVEAGRAVTGTVYLQVNQAEINCETIRCKIQGQESSQLSYRESSNDLNDDRAYQYTVSGQNSFLDQTFVLQDVSEGRILQGQYEYPFTFSFPASAPGSMSSSSGSGDQCRVEYTVEAWLEHPERTEVDVRHTRSITVVRPTPQECTKIPLYIEPCSVDLFTCCCIPRGSMLIGASAESYMLHAGTTASIRCAALICSVARIKAIEVSLREVVTFYAQGHFVGGWRHRVV
jgi:hypothetical protein